MSSEHTTVFTKDNLDTYLKELAKEYRKINGKTMPAEIILIGGASILVNYGFRDMTTDVDAIVRASSSMKDAVNRIGDRFDLPSGWLNSDFMRTTSYSPKLHQYSVFYRTFANILQIRTISSEYLIAMKLRSGREYKNDLSDILGILAEHERCGTPLTLEMIKQAVTNLYGSWDIISEDAKTFLIDAMSNGNYEQIYNTVRSEEKRSKDVLIQFEQDYPNVTNTENVNTILSTLKSKASLLEQLKSAPNKELIETLDEE